MNANLASQSALDMDATRNMYRLAASPQAGRVIRRFSLAWGTAEYKAFEEMGDVVVFLLRRLCAEVVDFSLGLKLTHMKCTFHANTTF